MGLVLAIGVVFAAVVTRWSEPGAPLLFGMGMIVVLLSVLTSSQVQVWSDRSLLLLNHLNTHPNSPRANIDMAVELARRGEIEAALDYSQRAFSASANKSSIRERSGDYEVRNLALFCLANKPVPPGLIGSVGAQDPNRPLSSVSTLLTMVRLLQDNQCPQFDRIAFADRLAEIYLVADYEHKGAATLFSNLAVLENALQRYDNAYTYADRFLVLNPDDTRGLLMKLHFATALGKEEEVNAVMAILHEMDQQGKLTVGEQQNMALYQERTH